MVDKYKLLLGLLGFHFVYFALGFLFQPYISSGVSIGLALASFFVMARYAKVTYGVLFRGLRNDEQDNSHIAAISIFGVAFGVFYGAAFNLVWQYSGSPIEWLGTHASNYGRFITALSFAGLFYSPQEVQKRIDTSLIVLGLAVVVVAVKLCGWHADQHHRDDCSYRAPPAHFALPSHMPGRSSCVGFSG